MTIKEALQFERNLYNLINTCGLPVDTAFYILKSVYLDFQKTLLECADQEPDDPITTEEHIYNMDEGPMEIKELKRKDEQSDETNTSESFGSDDDN
jgi:hypothetical protein